MVLEENRSAVEQKYFELSKSVVSDLGLGLYDVEFVKKSNTLRVYIFNEKTNTATIEECVAVDKAFSPHIDTNSWIPDSIILEISSPGLFRKLKTREHFERANNLMIELVLEQDIKEIIKEKLPSVKGKKIRAMIKTIKEKHIEIEINSKNICIDFEMIKKANLSPDIKF